ncbi:hypothetical protein [Tropicimonas marinistellae]|uniref:hypothetical protein n=1 Tax=Tropicimonas marinistellae TaxID=1739787 RepID=UPI00083268C3|nr:hypothetical protein [Tropicimonas marinistellae]
MAFHAAERPGTALVVLLGTLANDEKIAGLRGFHGRSFGADLFVPEVPFRRGFDHCAAKLPRYRKDDRVFDNHESTHFLPHIAGSCVLCALADELPDLAVERFVWVRGTIEECVPDAIDVLEVPESQDDVCTSDDALGAAISIFRTGRFADGRGAS